MDEQIAELEFTAILPDAPFRERHSRWIDQPIEQVWPTFLALRGNDIKLLAPLFRLRGLPARVLGRRPPAPVGEQRALDLFVDEGFVILRCDEEPVEGRATLIFGTAGRFWSPAHNGPLAFHSPTDFLTFDEPGNAKTVARFEAWKENGGTRLETETLVCGTDPASTRKFAVYWAVIRGPSGLLRRSWLAAADRRASTRST